MNARSTEYVDLLIDSVLRLPKSQQLEIYDALKDNLFQTKQASDEAPSPSIPGRRTSARDLFYRIFTSTPNTQHPTPLLQNHKPQATNHKPHPNWFPFWMLISSAALIGLWQPYIWPVIVAAIEWVRSW